MKFITLINKLFHTTEASPLLLKLSVCPDLDAVYDRHRVWQSVFVGCRVRLLCRSIVIFLSVTSKVGPRWPCCEMTGWPCRVALGLVGWFVGNIVAISRPLAFVFSTSVRETIRNMKKYLMSTGQQPWEYYWGVLFCAEIIDSSESSLLARMNFQFFN